MSSTKVKTILNLENHLHVSVMLIVSYPKASFNML